MNDKLYKGFSKQKCLVMAVGYFHTPECVFENKDVTNETCMWYWLFKYETGL